MSVAHSILINGDKKKFDPQQETTLSDLIKGLGVPLDHPGLAVAINGEVIQADCWPQTRIKPGDRLDLVHPVAGG